MSRAGAKRKFKGTTPSGRQNMHRLADDALAAQQPHRAWLPQDKRLSHKADTVLGCLNLLGRLTDEHYEAGNRYLVIVGKYRTVIGIPDTGNAGGRSFPCRGEFHCHPCQCKAIKDDYDQAFEALNEVGQRAARAVAHVAVYNRGCPEGDFEHLVMGLDRLAAHYGLTNQKKR